jgi:citrate synthase
LKSKNEELRVNVREKEVVERKWRREVQEREQLEECLQDVTWRKEQLKEMVKQLENQLRQSPHQVAQDLSQTKKVLHQLESQVLERQKEWQTQVSKLSKEKEQACQAAEFATRRLLETTADYRKQKNAQRILAENLVDKERRSQSPSSQVSTRTPGGNC